MSQYHILVVGEQGFSPLVTLVADDSALKVAKEWLSHHCSHIPERDLWIRVAPEGTTFDETCGLYLNFKPDCTWQELEVLLGVNWRQYTDVIDHDGKLGLMSGTFFYVPRLEFDSDNSVHRCRSVPPLMLFRDLSEKSVEHLKQLGA